MTEVARKIRLTSMAVAALFACGDRAAPPPISSAAASRDSAAPASTDRRPRVVIIGTSLTAGLGLDPEDAYPGVLQKMADSAGYNVSIVNAGLSGETSAGALRRVDWVLRDGADAVIIETGANDGLRALMPDSTEANIRAIIRSVRAKSPSVPVFVVQMEAPPNLGREYTTRFHDVFPRVAREMNATLIPFLLNGVAGDKMLNQEDGIHPTAAGARIVARNVWPTIEPTLRTLGAK